MKRKIGPLAIAAVILGGALVGCSSDTSNEPKEQKQEEVAKEEATEEVAETKETEIASEEISVEESATAVQVVAYKAMLDEVNKAKEGQEVDWDLISSTYVEGLQGAVTELNSEFDTAIVAGIEGGKSGQFDPNVARQFIDKTTQSYFYQKQKALHKDVAAALEAGDTAGAQLAFEELKHLAAEVLIPTATKRDGHFGTDVVAQIENGLSIQEKALTEGNVDDYKVYAQITDKSTYRSYYLAALGYAEKIEKAASEGADPVELQVMQAEGWGFLQSIIGSLSGGDEAAGQKLNSLYNIGETDPATIKVAEVSDLFTKAFIGKILSYHEKAPKSLEEGDVTAARTQSLEGNIFMKAIELVINEKLGEEKSAELFADAEKWFAAVSNENKEEAAELSTKIVEVLKGL